MADPTGNTGILVIDLPSEADSPEAAVRFLLDELALAGLVPEVAVAEIAREVWQRERLGATTIGRGVAIPHTQSPLVDGPTSVVGRCSQPLVWPGELDDRPVALVCLVIVPSGPAGTLFREMERVFRQLRDV